MNFFFVTASRHDSDRVELQVGFDGEVQSEKNYDFEVNIQFIFPRSLGLAENFDKEALKTQLQSHLRLHTHAGNPQNPTKLTRVRERFELILVTIFASFAADVIFGAIGCPLDLGGLNRLRGTAGGEPH